MNRESRVNRSWVAPSYTSTIILGVLCYPPDPSDSIRFNTESTTFPFFAFIDTLPQNLQLPSTVEKNPSVAPKGISMCIYKGYFNRIVHSNVILSTGAP